MTEAAALGKYLVDASPGFASGDDLEDGIFQIRMNNVSRQGELLLDERRRVSPENKKVSSSLLRPGDVLFNATNSPDLVGKTALFVGCDEPAVFSNHFIRLRTHGDRLDPEFLTRWLQRQFELGYFKAKSKQWVNQATFGKDRLVELQIPLPPIGEQRRIAAILDAAEALRAKRREAMAKLDTLTHAIFIDMFGDPLLNPSGWPQTPLAQIGEIVTGNTPPRAEADNYGTDIEWIKTDDINPSNIHISRAAEGLSAEGRKRARLAPPGSLLVACIAGSPASIGRAAVTDRDVAFNQQINALIPHEADVYFLHTLFLLGQRIVQAASTGAMKGMVSKSRFETIEMPLPPVELQQEYSQTAAQVRATSTTHQSGLSKLDELFASLQQRAFSGEL